MNDVTVRNERIERGYFFIVDRNSALLNQTAGFAVGRAYPRRYEDVYNSGIINIYILFRKVAAAAERRACLSLRRRRR